MAAVDPAAAASSVTPMEMGKRAEDEEAQRIAEREALERGREQIFQARDIAEREAMERLRELQSQVNVAVEELRELRRHQAQELRVVKAQNEKHNRDAAYFSRRRVRKAQDELSSVEIAATRAEQRLKDAQDSAAGLSRTVSGLQAKVQKNSQHADEDLRSLERMLDARVKRMTSQAQDRVSGMTEHAKEVCATSGAAVKEVAGELQDQMARAHMRVEGRVRFKELCELGSRRRDYNMTSEGYRLMKSELLSLWHAQTSVLTSPRPTSSTPAALEHLESPQAADVPLKLPAVQLARVKTG